MKKYLSIIAFAILLICARPAAADISFVPAESQMQGYDINVSCSIGDYFLQWSPSAVFDGSEACPYEGALLNLETEAGAYVFAECDSQIASSTCVGTYPTLEDFQADPGYVSDTQYEIIPMEPASLPPFATPAIVIVIFVALLMWGLDTWLNGTL